MFHVTTKTRSILEKLRNGVKRVGLRGVARSAYLSSRFTGDVDRLLLSPRTIVDIRADATLNLSGRLTVGTTELNASHDAIGKSLLRVTDSGRVRVPEDCRARVGPRSTINVEGDLTIGDSYINADSRIICGEEISIGDNCAIAWGVEILDDDRHQFRVDGVRCETSEPICIHDGVWIGHSASILKGVTIGEGAVVGAGSVVTDDVPSETLAAGNPARVIRDKVSWE